MELKEVYEKIGGDYDDVVRRLMGEKLVRKFLLKFLDDKSYDRWSCRTGWRESIPCSPYTEGCLPEPVTDKPLSGEQPAYRGIEK